MATGAVAQVVRATAPRIDLEPIVTSARNTLGSPVDRPLTPAVPPLLVMVFGALWFLRRRVV